MLRNVIESDLRTFFEHQCDPESAAMAAYPARHWDEFIDHWRNTVLGDRSNRVRTILVDEEVAGYVSSWEQEGRRHVAYWVGRDHWGRGVASSALGEFLRAHERHRPIHAYVALSNVRSIRVLEKCGFRRAGETVAASDGVIESLFTLDDGMASTRVAEPHG